MGKQRWHPSRNKSTGPLTVSKSWKSVSNEAINKKSITLEQRSKRTGTITIVLVKTNAIVPPQVGCTLVIVLSKVTCLVHVIHSLHNVISTIRQQFWSLLWHESRPLAKSSDVSDANKTRRPVGAAALSCNINYMDTQDVWWQENFPLENSCVPLVLSQIVTSVLLRSIQLILSAFDASISNFAVVSIALCYLEEMLRFPYSRDAFLSRGSCYWAVLG